MINIDKNKLTKRYGEITQDIHNKEFTSSTWIWVGLGAVTGFILSCLKINKKNIKPIIIAQKSAEDDLGITSRKWNSKNNKGC